MSLFVFFIFCILYFFDQHKTLEESQGEQRIIGCGEGGGGGGGGGEEGKYINENDDETIGKMIVS